MNLFYPSHDIALSNGVRHFNPPSAALQLQEDLASLAEIWNQPYTSGKSSIPLPWGWDWDTRRYIHDCYKIAYQDLPSDDDLLLIRQLSSRQTMIALQQNIEQLRKQPFAHRPIYLANLQEVFDYVQKQDFNRQRFVLKTPWSSSGRGLTLSHVPDAKGQLVPTSRQLMFRHAEATIRKMGGILAEDWVEEKQHDFALLFHASTQDVQFIGFSLFDNDESGSGTTYRQGYLLSNETIRDRLAIEHEELESLISACTATLTQLLQPLLGHHWELGFLGIDMLSYRPKSESKATPLDVQPVELNLRCTMGVVCRLWHDMHHQDGTFRISPMQEDGHFKAEFLTSQ